MNNILTNKDILYKDKLAIEWMDWVETSNPEGSREKDLFPEVLNWLKTTDPKSLLDIGCGQGIMSTLVSDKLEYTGVDISDELIIRANIKYASEKRKFTVGDAYKLPFENEKFDAVMSFWVWSHLESPAKVAKEMARVLKPEGHFIVVTANPQTYDIRRSFYSTYEEKAKLEC